MLERKKLAYGEGEKWVRRPKIMKSLVFSATFFACMTSCAPNIGAIPRREPVIEQARRDAARRAPQLERSCKPDLGNILRKGEIVRETVCREGRDFVLTSTSLIILERTQETLGGSGSFSGPNIDRFFTRTDMSDIYARGLVDWEATPGACYFLTADRSLTVYPNAGMGDTVPSFELGFETTSLGRSAMAYHSGFVFLTAPGQEAIAFGDDGQRRMLPLVSAGQGFSSRGGRLFLGNAEIVVRSQRIEEIEIRR